MRSIFFISIFLISFALPVHADENWPGRQLTYSQIERLKEVKGMLEGIDNSSIEESVHELEKTHHPLIALQVKEAEAKAFVDIVHENNVIGQTNKKWLYSMVCLNMAYLQFGGGINPGDNSLNKLIRQKLRGYLPSGTLEKLGAMYSL